LRWEHRGDELRRMIATGTPCNAPVLPGHRWYIICAKWFDGWLRFVASTRRMAPPGPVNNAWMLRPASDGCGCSGAAAAALASDQDGDYRRVTPAVWKLFMELYGGGPQIYVEGPPIDDTSRWKILY
ncbi:unnamed protein product, partial [Phaeothamnion confervicola]